MKKALYAFLYAIGADNVFRFLHRKSLTIVLYHGVAPRASQGIYNYRGKFIPPESFRWQMRYLKTHYHVLSLEEAIEKSRAGTLPRRALAVTFDDGYRNMYEYAFPILREYAIPATMFLATDFVLRGIPLWVDRLEYALGRGSAPRAELMRRDTEIRSQLKACDDDVRERRLADIERENRARFGDFEEDRAVYAPLTLPQIREMGNSGIAFGAHTRTHPILTRVPRERLENEIQGSKEELERVCGKISSVFAYPNGQPEDFNDMIIDIVRETGCTAALTTIEEFNDAETPSYSLRRIALDGADSRGTFANMVAGVRLFLRTLRV